MVQIVFFTVVAEVVKKSLFVAEVEVPVDVVVGLGSLLTDTSEVGFGVEFVKICTFVYF